jgi:hypothetical protein
MHERVEDLGSSAHKIPKVLLEARELLLIRNCGLVSFSWVKVMKEEMEEENSCLINFPGSC